MNEHTQPTRCLLCRAEVYDQAALCPACEEALDDTDSAVRAQQLDALTPVRREPMRAQRGAGVMEYSAILIDPPWSFQVYSKKGQGRSPEHHYPTMQPDALEALPIQPLMARHCAVFMWVTWPTMPQALALGAAWGLTYKTCAFLWAKTTKKVAYRYSLLPIEDNDHWHLGMGYWTRANTEPCLLFTKGSPKRKARDVRQLVVSMVQRHSQKPDCIYSKIESLVDGPYLEMFARQKYPGWHSWGNEVESDVQLSA